MEQSIITFQADEQELVKTGGVDKFASSTVAYVEAQFTLGTNWTGFDSVRAMWRFGSDVMSTVLDHEGKCQVPHELLEKRGELKVNLVGSIVEDEVISDRLTTYPIVALIITKVAMVTSDEVEVSPSQFEQFVAIVKDDADRAEDARDDAESAESSASQSAEDADIARINAESAQNSAEIAQGKAEDAQEEAERLVAQIQDLSATGVQLLPSEQAYASYNDSTGILTIGIPQGVQGEQGEQGDKGDKGDTGATGATGATGNGIASVAKTSTSGLVDTYTITYTNGQTTTFEVTNGSSGVDAEARATLEENFKTVLGKNLINPNTLSVGFLNSDGTINASLSEYLTSDFTPIENGKTYFFWQTGVAWSNAITNTRHLSLLYDENKNLIDGTYQNQNNVSGLQIIVNNADAKYVRVSVHMAGSTNYLELQEGTTYNLYFEPYKETVKMVKSLGDEVLAQISKSTALEDFCEDHSITLKQTKQLIDGSKLQAGYNPPSGYKSEGGTSYVYTDFIDVSEHTGDSMYFSANGNNTYGPRFITAYDADRHPVEASGVNNNSNGTLVYTIPSGISFVIVSYKAPVTNPVYENFQAEWDEVTPYSKYGKQFDYSDIVKQAGNVLYGKKWAVCGDSFSNGGGTGTTIQEGIYKGKNYVYSYLIGNRNSMNILKFFEGGQTLAYPASEDFTNCLTCPTSPRYYQNIPSDVDYITIYLGINDSHHENGIAGDGEDPTGVIPLGTITDNTTATYYGAWNVVLTWLITNRPFAHIGILVSNGCDREAYRTAQLEIARKYGIPFIDLNGDDRTPVMIRSQNPNIAGAVKTAVNEKQRVSSTNTHPNDAAQLYESYFIENFLRSI